VRKRLIAERARSFSALLAIVFALFFALSGNAYALTTDKATARPNEDGGKGVIGNMATRLTWQGTVDEGEVVTSVVLSLPEGADFSDTSTKITVLDGLDRTPIKGEAIPAGNNIEIKMEEGIPEGYLLRLEIEGMKFPAEGGDIAVGGSYTTEDGQSLELVPSKPIKVIQNTWLQQQVNALNEMEWVKVWNSSPFLGMFFKPQLILTSLFSLFPGWLVCLGIVFAAYPFAIILGLIFALMKISQHKIVRAIAIVKMTVVIAMGVRIVLQCSGSERLRRRIC
jgi:polar amino acid transport system substrate-binding protein